MCWKQLLDVEDDFSHLNRQHQMSLSILVRHKYPKVVDIDNSVPNIQKLSPTSMKPIQL